MENWSIDCPMKMNCKISLTFASSFFEPIVEDLSVLDPFLYLCLYLDLSTCLFTFIVISLSSAWIIIHEWFPPSFSSLTS